MLDIHILSCCDTALLKYCPAVTCPIVTASSEINRREKTLTMIHPVTVYIYIYILIDNSLEIRVGMNLEKAIEAALQYEGDNMDERKYYKRGSFDLKYQGT